MYVCIYVCVYVYMCVCVRVLRTYVCLYLSFFLSVFVCLLCLYNLSVLNQLIDFDEFIYVSYSTDGHTSFFFFFFKFLSVSGNYTADT